MDQNKKAVSVHIMHLTVVVLTQAVEDSVLRLAINLFLRS